jgi:competence protein ComEC
VLRLAWDDVSFLLTADIEGAAEQALVDRGAALDATVLKVGHHGSKTSSTRAFLDAVQPSIAVVSAGRDNRFGHPATEVVERLDDYALVYNTAETGDVHFETDGHRLWVSR